MEGIMEKQICAPKQTPSALGMHKNSQAISKGKPKIRIIHIFAPEIIKTDAANFRELVQRLTGKPTDDETTCRVKKRSRISRKKESTMFAPKMEVDMRTGFHHAASAAELRERRKGEEEIWRGADSGGGFLGGFAEFDGFMQELNQFPFLAGAAQMDAYGESQLV